MRESAIKKQGGIAIVLENISSIIVVLTILVAAAAIIIYPLEQGSWAAVWIVISGIIVFAVNAVIIKPWMHKTWNDAIT
jgi:hypothetical protein